MVEIKFIALRRSGHHAIINWVLHQMQNYIFVNDPLGTHYKNITNNMPVESLIANESLLKKFATNPKLVECKPPFKHLVYNIESKPYSTILPMALTFEKNIEILVIRDFLNNISSLLERKLTNPYGSVESIANAIQVWKNHANTYIHNNKVIKINYNEWVKSYDYRKKIAELLPMTFTDKGINEVVSWGLGSSFDKTVFNGQAQKMDLFNRYKKYAHSPYLLDAINDKNANELNEKIFNYKYDL